jgi:hypothetical protein
MDCMNYIFLYAFFSLFHQSYYLKIVLNYGNYRKVVIMIALEMA